MVSELGKEVHMAKKIGEWVVRFRNVILAAAVILFVVLAVKLSFLSFLKLSFGLGLIAAFWALLYRYMYYARGAVWIAAVFVIGFLAAGVCWLLIRLFGLQHLY